MIYMLHLLLEKLKMFPIIGILLLGGLFILIIMFYYGEIKLSYLLMLLFFLSTSSAIYSHFYSFSDKEVLLLIVWYLGVFSFISYKEQKGFSFFFLYFALYFMYFYCVSSDNITISSTLLSYIFYLTLFFAYHYYFTFTQRFILRSYSVVKVFFCSYSLIKLILWVFFILLPTLINNVFIFFLVFNQFLLLTLLAGHTIILFFLTLLYIWFSFLSISNYFKLFPKVRQEIVKYFSRRACLHFIGNSAGSRLSPHLPAILIAAVSTIPAIAGPLNDATTSANNAGETAITNYKVTHPSASPLELQTIFNEAFFESLNLNPYASIVHNATGGAICKPRLVDGNTILYTDPSSVAKAQRKLPKLTTDNSDERALSELYQRHVDRLNQLKDDLDEDFIKNKLFEHGLKDDNASVADAKNQLAKKLTEAANQKLDSYYAEKGIERPEEIVYDDSDGSFSSKSSDSGSQISSEQSLDGEDRITSAALPLDKDTVENWVKDQGQGK